MGLANLNILCRKHSSDHKHHGEGEMIVMVDIFFLQTLSIYANGPEEGFAIPLSITLGAGMERKALPFSHGSEAMFLDKLLSMSTAHIH